MKPFKLPHAATIIGLVVLGGILLTQRVTMKRHFVKEPLKIVLDRNINMTRTTSCDDVIAKLSGIRCGDKPTSCPDQLCRALEQLKQMPLQA